MVDAVTAGVPVTQFWQLTLHEIWVAISAYRRRLIHQQALASYAGVIACRPYMSGNKQIRPPFEEE